MKSAFPVPTINATSPLLRSRALIHVNWAQLDRARFIAVVSSVVPIFGRDALNFQEMSRQIRERPFFRKVYRHSR
jgi:hypothetical protein